MELKRKTPVRYFAFIIFVLFIAACGGSADFSPKPRGYFRIVFPKKEYQHITKAAPLLLNIPNIAK
jgi:hypothetical protein